MVSTSGTSRARTSAASAAPASASTLRQPWPRDRRSSSPAPCLTPAPPPPPLALPDPLLHTQSAPPVEGTHCHHCPPAPSTPPTYPCTTLYQPNSTDSLASPFHTSMEEHKNAHVNPHPPPSSSVAPPTSDLTSKSCQPCFAGVLYWAPWLRKWKTICIWARKCFQWLRLGDCCSETQEIRGNVIRMVCKKKKKKKKKPSLFILICF